jgi:hypothetical protein
LSKTQGLLRPEGIKILKCGVAVVPLTLFITRHTTFYFPFAVFEVSISVSSFAIF